jgi:hypothetical protein
VALHDDIDDGAALACELVAVLAQLSVKGIAIEIHHAAFR